MVQSISRVLLSVTPRTAAYWASQSFPISPSLVKLVSKASGAIQPSHPAATFSSCSFPFYCFLLFLCTVHFRRLSYLSLLFSGTLHSVGYTVPLLPCFLLLFFLQLFVKSPQTTTVPSCISFSLGWFCSLPPIQYYEPLSTDLQALCLLDLIPWIYSSPPLYNHRGFDLDYTGLVVFLANFNLSLNIALRCWWFEPQSTPGLVFADIYSFSIFGHKECNQSDLGFDHLVSPMCKVSLMLLKKSVCYDQCVLLAELC